MRRKKSEELVEKEKKGRRKVPDNRETSESIRQEVRGKKEGNKLYKRGRKKKIGEKRRSVQVKWEKKKVLRPLAKNARAGTLGKSCSRADPEKGSWDCGWRKGDYESGELRENQGTRVTNDQEKCIIDGDGNKASTESKIAAK